MIKFCIVISTVVLFGCSEKSSNNYFECMLISAKNPIKSSGFTIEEICNQIHPARLATAKEMEFIEIYIYAKDDSGFKQLQIINKTADFLVTEVIVNFSNDDVTMPIKYTTNSKPYGTEWTSSLYVGFKGQSKTSDLTIKGRTYK